MGGIMTPPTKTMTHQMTGRTPLTWKQITLPKPLQPISTIWMSRRTLAQVELVRIYLPSNIPTDQHTNAIILDILQIELRLQKGQANDILHEICISVAAKSFLFRDKLRGLKAKKQKAA